MSSVPVLNLWQTVGWMRLQIKSHCYFVGFFIYYFSIILCWKPWGSCPLLVEGLCISNVRCRWFRFRIVELVAFVAWMTFHGLMELIHHWQQAHDTQNVIKYVTVSVEFPKASDSVHHTILLKKNLRSGRSQFPSWVIVVLFSGSNNNAWRWGRK